jgi:glycine cleavage system aminomethyltransferase T
MKSHVQAVVIGGQGGGVGLALSRLAEDTRPDAFEVEILGERRAATLIKEPLFDPSGLRMRS